MIGKRPNWSCFFVIPSGFEPETHSLEGCCSIQLSYGTILIGVAKIVIFPETANLYLGLKDSSSCVSWVTASEKPSCASEAGKLSSSVPFSWSMDRLLMPTAIIL